MNIQLPESPVRHDVAVDVKKLYQDSVTKPVSVQVVFSNKPIRVSHRYCRLLDDLSLGEG